MTDTRPSGRSWPISQYVVKVHSRCDLACDHCYVYEHVDQNWRAQPRAIARGTVQALARRIAEHAATHRLPRVTVVLHGGEPLLLGPQRLREVVADLRDGIEPATRLDLRMQSNGVLLSEQFCEILVEYDIKLGISLDGDRAANDRHRRFAGGASSHAKVLRALELLRRPPYRAQYAGILCTVDIANDPQAVYQALRAEQPPRLDLLLPHATWDRPPVRPEGTATPYARWLLAIHDSWVADGRPMSIRLFDSLRSTASGGPSGNEWVGLDPSDLVVVETDGTWEQVDSLKTTFAGAPATGMDLFTHSVDDVSAHPQIARRQTGLSELSATCRACPVVNQCGGGLFAHRYRSATGFDNPSAYCADLKELIMGLNERMAAEPAPVAAVDDGGVPQQLLTRIGSGRIDEVIVRQLADAQLSFTRALVVAVADGGSPTGRAAWEVLGELDRAHPAAVSAVLAHPYLRVWAVDALHRLTLDTRASDYLACVAAAAAVRAGVEAELTVPVRAGLIVLPSVGAVRLPVPVGGSARLSLTSQHCTVEHEAGVVQLPLAGAPAYEHAEGGQWLANRWSGGSDGGVLIEDLDPHRDCHDWKAAERLDARTVESWCNCLAEAWEIIARDAPDQLPALRAGLRAIVPLAADPAQLLRSSTARHAFGSVAVALADPDAVAMMIVHEFQHNILGALLDLCDLYDPSHTQRLRVAWRSDLRPVEGVLQGTYAHRAVTEMWRMRAAAGPGSDAQAHFEQYFAWTESAVQALQDCGALTPAGETFVAAMAGRLSEIR